jgi:hypothetical protein
MAPRPRIDPKLVRATRRLATEGLTNAEIVRTLQPLAAKLRAPVPSHETVRRIASPARAKAARLNPYTAEIIGSLLTGRLPNFYAVDSQLELQAPSGPCEAISRVRRGAS